ncbi:MAG TPA: hypothetical protein VMU27_02415 [Candidatus Paceibacterota bacterium]|nr:hypothetical protein [Candidatus Paceibacterota bacterium]
MRRGIFFEHIRTLWTNRSEPEYARAFAGLYWRGLLCVVLIALISSSFFATALYSSTTVPLTSPSAPVTSSAKPAFNDEALKTILQELTNRQNAFQSLQAAGRMPVSDPAQAN